MSSMGIECTPARLTLHSHRNLLSLAAMAVMVKEAFTEYLAKHTI